MSKSRADIVRYIPDDHIFIVNMSGKIDERELTRRAGDIRKCFRCHLKGSKTIKVLVDFRNVRWDSEVTHRKARTIIDAHLAEFRGYEHFSAIVNNQYDGRTSERECLFTKEQFALNWLKSK